MFEQNLHDPIKWSFSYVDYGWRYTLNITYVCVSVRRCHMMELGSQNDQLILLISPFWLPSSIMWQQWVSLWHFIFNINILLQNKTDKTSIIWHVVELVSENGQTTQIDIHAFNQFYFEVIYSHLIKKRSSKIVSKLCLNYVPSIGSFSWVLRIDWYQKFPKIRTKSWSKSIAKLMSSEKRNFDRVKLWNWNFGQLRMIVFDLGYLLLGWFCCWKYESRENP